MEKKRDPICGMEVKDETFSFEYEGRTYCFCSLGCLEKFRQAPQAAPRKQSYDLIIVGGGPAGLTAAVYASVLKIDTLLITKDVGGQAVDSTKIKNYMGFDFISGKDLVDRFRHQFLHEHYLDHLMDEVVSVRPVEGSLEILPSTKTPFTAHAVILATGMTRNRLGIPGEERLLRKGVSFRAVQDMARFAGLDAMVVGGGNSAVQTAIELKHADCRVTVVSNERIHADPHDIEQLTGYEGVDTYEAYDVVEIHGDQRVEGATIRSRKTDATTLIPCRGVFIQIGFAPNVACCRDLVDLNDKGEIIINSDCSTSTPGVFACGDVTDCFGKRIVISSGEGAKAALRAKRHLDTLKS